MQLYKQPKRCFQKFCNHLICIIYVKSLKGYQTKIYICNTQAHTMKSSLCKKCIYSEKFAHKIKNINCV